MKALIIASALVGLVGVSAAPAFASGHPTHVAHSHVVSVKKKHAAKSSSGHKHTAKKKKAGDGVPS